MIYFVQADIIGRIKIGTTADENINKRLEKLRTACPVGLTVLLTLPGGRKKEARLHERFAADRLHGEWFNPSANLIRYICKLSGKKIERALDRKPKRSVAVRKHAAMKWLIERFRERLEWKSSELFEAARNDSISRNAIYEAKLMLDMPKPRSQSCNYGSRLWVWWVPENWTHFNTASI